MIPTFGFLAFLFQVFFYEDQNLPFAVDSKEKFKTIINSFQRTQHPREIIDFSSIYAGHHQLDVLHPVFSMHHIHFKEQGLACDENEIPATINSSVEKAQCDNTFKDISKSNKSFLYEEEKKQNQFKDFLQEGIRLPDDFILRPPFVDPRGFSYAYYLATRNISPYNDRNWIEHHLSLFKVTELSEILERYQIHDSVFFIISQLSETEMEDVIRGNLLVLTRNYLFVRDQSELGFSPLKFSVYDRTSFNEGLKNFDYELIPYEPSSFCFEKIGNACWTLSSKKSLSYLYRYAKFFLVTLLLIFGGLLIAYIRYEFAKKKDEKLKRISLQVLSHEFRTPVSSLLLSSERLNRSFEDFSQDHQDLMASISSDVYKLQRIIEISRNYLQATNGTIQFNHHKIISINECIQEFLENQYPDVLFELLEQDLTVTTDLFWLKFVLSSLLENSFRHGSTPVVLKLKSEKSKIYFSVQDNGICTFRKLTDMTEPFVKSSKSQGMGLGLNIVDFIVREWGNEIKFMPNPTTFTLVIHNKEMSP
ncbi:MAG: sensor histidine kinase [Bdellovibrio sp.]